MALNNTTNSNQPQNATKKKASKDHETLAKQAEAISIAADSGTGASTEVALQVNGEESSSESNYVKEIQRNIRNVTKKLTGTRKVDTIVDENPGSSLDELIAARKINHDQKAQILKKPALQSQLAQLEEQLTQYKKFEETIRAQAEKEKEHMRILHREELAEAKIAGREEAKVETGKASREQLLILSKFLRAAAARRQMDDGASDESKAFEGLLLLLYGGDSAAVDAAEKLIQGSGDGVTSTEDAILPVAYSRVKELSESYSPFAAEEAWRQEVAETEQSNPNETSSSGQASHKQDSDPTLVNASLTEIEQNNITQTDTLPEKQITSPTQQASADSVAANAAAAQNWTTNNSNPTIEEGWDMVPRDVAETDAPSHTAAPTNATENWGDSAPDPPLPPPVVQPVAPNDGFHEVHHHRGGGPRGRGYENRGPMRGRGNFRGGDGNNNFRGRGGFRGDRGGEGGYRGRGGRGRGGRGREG